MTPIQRDTSAGKLLLSHSINSKEQTNIEFLRYDEGSVKW